MVTSEGGCSGQHCIIYCNKSLIHFQPQRKTEKKHRGKGKRGKKRGEKIFLNSRPSRRDPSKSRRLVGDKTRMSALCKSPSKKGSESRVREISAEGLGHYLPLWAVRQASLPRSADNRGGSGKGKAGRRHGESHYPADRRKAN